MGPAMPAINAAAARLDAAFSRPRDAAAEPWLKAREANRNAPIPIATTAHRPNSVRKEKNPETRPRAMRKPPAIAPVRAALIRGRPPCGSYDTTCGESSSPIAKPTIKNPAP